MIPPGTPETVRVGKANSGRWHILGEYGCQAVSRNAEISETRTIGNLVTGTNRDWCFYCRLYMEILRLRVELESHEDDSTEATES